MNNDTLQRYIEGNATQQEKDDIAKWLDADESNMEEFLILRSLYDATLWHSRSEVEESQLHPSKTNKRKTIFIEFLKIAVVFLIAFATYYFFFPAKYIDQDAYLTTQTIYSPEGQRSEVTLSDGTRVWLNARSSLSFPDQFSDTARIVELNGEAYFDVAHHETNRFVVKTPKYHVKVLGTEFNVIAYPEKDLFETSLIRGSIEVVSDYTDEKVVLTPNNKVKSSGGKFIVSELVTHDQFLWKKGIMSFDNEGVIEIMEKLEYYYGVKINVKNENLLENRYTGKFWTKDGVEHVLKVLQLRHKFSYTIDDMNNITIY